MKKLFVFILLLAVSAQFSFAQQKEFSWLKGTWKIKDKNVYEVWSVDRDVKSLSGISLIIKNGDTTITEQIKLVTRDGAFYYVPDVAGDQGPIDFKITNHTSDSFVAENQLHDFPKVIRYHLVRKENKDYIEATIEGNGKVIAYFFERLK